MNVLDLKYILNLELDVYNVALKVSRCFAFAFSFIKTRD